MNFRQRYNHHRKWGNSRRQSLTQLLIPIGHLFLVALVLSLVFLSFLWNLPV